MKKTVITVAVGLLFLASAFTFITGNWSVKDENYTIKFTSSKMDGTFKGLKSDLTFDENNLATSKLTATIDAATVKTGNSWRDKHARQSLDTEKYPTIKFESESIVKSGNGYIALGKLFLKDAIKAIKIPFTFTRNSSGGVFEGAFTIKPEEYNVTKMGTPEEVTIQLSIPVTK